MTPDLGLVQVRRDDLTAVLDAFDIDYASTRDLPDLEERVNRLWLIANPDEDLPDDD